MKKPYFLVYFVFLVANLFLYGGVEMMAFASIYGDKLNYFYFPLLNILAYLTCILLFNFDRKARSLVLSLLVVLVTNFHSDDYYFVRDVSYLQQGMPSSIIWEKGKPWRVVKLLNGGVRLWPLNSRVDDSEFAVVDLEAGKVVSVDIIGD